MGPILWEPQFKNTSTLDPQLPIPPTRLSDTKLYKWAPKLSKLGTLIPSMLKLAKHPLTLTLLNPLRLLKAPCPLHPQQSPLYPHPTLPFPLHPPTKDPHQLIPLPSPKSLPLSGPTSLSPHRSPVLNPSFKLTNIPSRSLLPCPFPLREKSLLRNMLPNPTPLRFPNLMPFPNLTRFTPSTKLSRPP